MTEIRSPLFPADNPAVTTHINVVQGIINRLANNSSTCKTWCVALVGAFLSLAGATHNPTIAGSVLVPIVVFGFVDAMYLAQEKAYRDLYERIVAAVQSDSYKLRSVFEARADRTLRHVWWALASWSVWPIYGGLILAYLIAAWRGWFELLAAAPVK
ncbi:hypothetical protein [Bradyrhizobium sp. S3.9.1]|uniref:hypothetical protein n=1 Tax=Bradyrhizobium sp. S3.9.1 TaxID=3156431 RepID=UPI003391D3DD